MGRKWLFNFMVCAVTSTIAMAQKRNAQYENYIYKYKDIAIEQMMMHKIPASITLAQGIFESGAGKSELAINTNNHFGIKQGGGWNGPVYTHPDDKKDDKFRVYNSVSQSFEDHSQILLKPRYQRLFNLNILDYKGWAKGLRECGYATNPNYPERLINIIELYQLNEIDRQAIETKGKKQKDNLHEDVVYIQQNNLTESQKRIYSSNNGVDCVKALRGDTWDSLAKELNVKKKKLLKFNEATEQTYITEGSFIYTQKKQNKGPKDMEGKWHHIKRGESMYSIAQLYGVNVKVLYKINFKSTDFTPSEGDIIMVR